MGKGGVGKNSHMHHAQNKLVREILKDKKIFDLRSKRFTT